MTRQFNLQDAFLNSARKSKTPVTIHVTNGYQIKNAVITGYDNFVVTVDAEGTQMMIYKSAISTVTPNSRITIHHNNEEQEK
ncbi:MAG: RNA chaperone Hfq [Clostridia bacterium]|nr:RNA chaperone Hfq [Clostridia bacterium]MBQ4611662.1 RNA chaperone Hfq [Clostridia bacterium]